MATPNGSPDGNLYGIDYEESAQNGAYRLEISSGSGRGQRVFFVDWSDRITFAKYLTGYTTADNNPTTPNVINYRPAQFPSYSALYCKGVTIEGMGAQSNNNGVPTFPFAKITATYEPIKLNSDDETDEEEVLATFEADFSGDFLTWGKFKFYWDASQEYPIEDQQLGRFVPQITYRYTENNCPVDKRALIASYVGKINSASWEGAAEGTLLYMGASVSKTITADGDQPFNIVHNFIKRPDASWNLFFRPQTRLWEYIYGPDGTIYLPYDSADFDGLIS